MRTPTVMDLTPAISPTAIVALKRQSFHRYNTTLCHWLQQPLKRASLDTTQI